MLNITGNADIYKGVAGHGTPRKFPSPEDDNAEDLVEQLVMTSIPIHPMKIAKPAVKGYKNDEGGHCNFVINHEGRFKVLWDWVILVLVMFTAIQIPYYAAFSDSSYTVLDVMDKDNMQPVLILSLIVDCMFVLDIFLNFRTTYIESTSNVVERNPRKLAIHYSKTWFIIDLLAAIPFDWIVTRKEFGGSTSDLVGLLKSARLLRLFRVARKLDRYSEYGVAVLFLLMGLFTLIAHWFACIWNAIAKMEVNNPNSWAIRMQTVLNKSSNGTIRKLTSSERYVASLYFIVSSMTSVGFGNVAATTEKEQLFSVIIMLAGALMYACIFGNMVAIVQRLYSKASTFHTHINTVREFMKFYKIPEELRTSINTYVRREWNVSQGIDAELVLQRFPECIQADLTYELYQHLFHNTKPFRDATHSCMRALSMKFKTMTLQQNNYAIRQGEELNKLYVIGKGALEVLVDGVLVSYLTRNTTFGYDFVKQLKRPKSKGNVRAVKLCEIHYISKDDLLEIMEIYPKFARQFQETFIQAYDLNDTEEEGYYQIEHKKEKLHVAAMARQALKMPILASWYKVDKKHRSECSDSLNENATAPYMNGNSESCVRNKPHMRVRQMSFSADHLHIVQKQSNDSRQEQTVPTVTLSPNSCNSSYNNINHISREHTIEDRITVLERDIYKMQKKIDAKLSMLIGMFDELQTTNWRDNVNQQQDHHFVANNTDNKSIEVDITTPSSNVCLEDLYDRFASVDHNKGEEESLAMQDTNL